jgi:Zn-finger nucleic acid-binding protein
MTPKKVNDIEIDYCDQCRGVWLNGGELESLTGLNPKSSRIMVCSDCEAPMGLKRIRDVEIDFCPECDAVWLDAGELEKLSGIDPETGEAAPLHEFIETEILRRLGKI